MRKLITILILLALVSTAFAALTYDQDYYVKNKRSMLSGSSNDPLFNLIDELDDLLSGTTGQDFFYLTPGEAPDPCAEGQLYYDASGDVVKFRNGSSAWITLASSTSGTLDEAYDAGTGITVDNGAVTLTAPNAADNDVLALVQSDATGGTSVLTLTNAGTGAALEITNSSSGGDIKGTGNTWSISKAGAFVIDGSITLSTADVLFDSSGAGVDVQFDESAHMMHFLDATAGSAILGFGGSASGAADISFTFDASGDANDLDITGSGNEIAIGATGNAGLDVIIWGLSGDYVTFGEDESALIMTDYDIWLDGTADLFFGGTKNIGFDMSYDASKTMSLLAGAATDDFVFNIGADQSGIDVQMYGTTTSTTCTWDAGLDTLIFNGGDLRLQADDILAFGDTEEMTFAFDGGDLDILGDGLEIAFGKTDEGIDLVIWGATSTKYVAWDESENEWNFGVTDYGVEVKFWGDEGGDYMLWDESEEELYFEDAFLVLNEGSDLIFQDSGDATDWAVDCDTALTLDFVPNTTGDDAAFRIGSAAATADVIIYTKTAGETFTWDAGADSLTVKSDLALFTMTGTTLPFHVNATGTGGDNVMIQLETTDGAIMLLADGDTEGDIDLDAHDDITFTAEGALTYAITGAVSHGGSQISNTLLSLEVVTSQTNELTAAESGKTVVSNYTGTQTHTLPDAAAGLWFIFIDNDDTGGDDVHIDPQAGDNIDHDTNGHEIRSATDAYPQTIMLIALNGTDWATVGKIGTWAQE